MPINLLESTRTRKESIEEHKTKFSPAKELEQKKYYYVKIGNTFMCDRKWTLRKLIEGNWFTMFSERTFCLSQNNKTAQKRNDTYRFKKTVQQSQLYKK